MKTYPFQKTETPIKLVTHAGRFHSDDLFSYVMLRTLFPNHTLSRTRNVEEISKANIAFDVGAEYSPKNGRFDHHQANPPSRENGSLYSSIGLLWKEWGKDYVGTYTRSNNPKINESITNTLETQLIQAIDASDCGEAIWEVGESFFGFNTTWLEENKEAEQFQQAADTIELFMRQMIDQAHNLQQGEKLNVQIIQTFPSVIARKQANALAQEKAVDILKTYGKKAHGSPNPNLLELPHYAIPWPILIHNIPECKAITHVTFQAPTNNWMLQCVAKPSDPFTPITPLPKAWAGKREEDLDKLTGFPGSVFCHNKCFICAHKTKEGAITLFKKARNYQKTKEEPELSI